MRKLIFILIGIIIPSISFAAIAFDNTGTASTGSGTSITLSFTVTGSNTFMSIAVLGNTSDTITGCTYNGTSLAKTVTSAPFGNVGRYTHIFTLINPATGTHDAVCNSSSATFMRMVVSSYTGVAQTGEPYLSQTYTAASGSSFALSKTTTIDNSWLLGMAVNGANLVSVSTNTTNRYGSGTDVWNYGDTNAAQTPAGTYALNFTATSDSWVGNLIVISPFGAATPATSFGTLTFFDDL